MGSGLYDGSHAGTGTDLEADLQAEQYVYRPQRSAQQAISDANDKLSLAQSAGYSNLDGCVPDDNRRWNWLEAGRLSATRTEKSTMS